MPTIGGVSIGWDETIPVGTENCGLGNDRMQSLKTSLRQALAAEHNWPSATGSGFGYHVQGSARPFYGTRSQVSSSGSDGRLMLTSDTSQLFAVGSGGTLLLGGAQIISAGSYPSAVPQRHYWAEEFGVTTTDSSGSTTITFPNSGFSGVPYVFLTANAQAGASEGKITVSVDTQLTFSNTQMRVAAYDIVADQYVAAGIFWRSIGTRVL